MSVNSIEEFGKILVQKVRDSAIQSNDRELLPTANTPIAERWRKSVPDGDLQHIGNVLIPDVVDDTIFYLLQAIDQGVLQVSFLSPDGKTVDLCKEGKGELSGWYMGSDGWRAMFAKERFFDDLSDLKLDL